MIFLLIFSSIIFNSSISLKYSINTDIKTSFSILIFSFFNISHFSPRKVRFISLSVIRTGISIDFNLSNSSFNSPNPSTINLLHNSSSVKNFIPFFTLILLTSIISFILLTFLPQDYKRFFYNIPFSVSIPFKDYFFHYFTTS